VSYFRSPAGTWFLQTTCLPERNRSTILILYDVPELLIEIADLQIAMRHVHHRQRSS
jgi:hypothetical protein